MSKYVWYRFKTRSVDDYRPLIDMKTVGTPWWCSGTAMDGSYAIIVCYLPKVEDLYKYWDDAYDIDSEERSEITYTDRFPKPEWLPEADNVEFSTKWRGGKIESVSLVKGEE